MGHSGPDDRTFKEYYRSRRFIVDTGNLFRGEEPRKDKREVLSMCLSRDSKAPKRLTEGEREDIYATDQK